MQKVEELKQWQKQYQARLGSGDGAVHSPSTANQERVREENGMFNMSSPSMHLKAPNNLTMKSDILDLDNGIHMIDELLNRIQRKSTESRHGPSSNVSPTPPFQRPSLPSHSPPQRPSIPPSSPPLQRPSLPSYDLPEIQDESHEGKPKRAFLKRGEGLSRFRMTLNDFKKPVPKPSFAMSRFRRKKTASHPVAVPDKRPSASQPDSSRRPSAGTRPELMSKAALTHLETWSNMFGSNQANVPSEGCPNDQETRANAIGSEGGGNSQSQNSHTSRVDLPTSVKYPNDQNARSTRTDRFDQGPRSTLPLSERYPYHQTARSNIFSSVQGSNHQPEEMSPLTQHRSQISSELDRRKKKEAEEQKVFEMLEQRARDSSFTSTSSLVAKLMEDSVMSTPVKSGLPQNPSSSAGPDSGRTDKGSHVRFSDSPQVETIAEVEESGGDRTDEGFTIEQLPHTHADTTEECECESECDTHYSSSDEGEDIPSVEEAIKSYRTVLNKPAGDCGKPRSHSSLDEYLKLAQPLRSLPPNTQATHPRAQSSNNNAVVKETKNNAVAKETKNNAVTKETKNNAVTKETKNNVVVKETKQLLAEIRKLQEERRRREAEEEEGEGESNKENERRGGGRGRGRASFPRTVYQETFQRPGGGRGGVPSKKPMTSTEGLKSFGSEDPQPNPFEHTSEHSARLELLRKRLGDLENEIHVFRLENIKLNKERKEFEKDKAAFTRARRASEKALQDEKAAFTREMEEEKNKLNKEKKVFLKYAKDARSFPSKPEREELSKLREELRAMKEEVVKKETKWAAGQARLRNHVKVLEAQNSDLKVQLEKMGKEAKKVSFASKKHISNTQIMNAINSQISKLTKSDVLPPPPTSILKKHPPLNTPTQPPATPSPNHPTNNSSNQSPTMLSQPTHDTSTVLPHSTSPSVPSSYNLTVTPRENEARMPEDSFDRVIYQSLYSGETRQSAGSEDTPSHDDDVIPIETLDLAGAGSPDVAECREVVTSDGTRERHYGDGRQEIHYPNGNTLIVSEAGQYVKMFYYNGDIKETDSADGTVRYFYAESHTWHTTRADGTEVLEFRHGQRETRHRDGRVEIEYAERGCRRLIGKDGCELWSFDAGPVETLETQADGQRVLRLRNGQREIHTRDYKRREFPDGAVKLVYPDGIQETRYPNGRIRLKDGEGNLIMDSHEM